MKTQTIKDVFQHFQRYDIGGAVVTGFLSKIISTLSGKGPAKAEAEAVGLPPHDDSEAHRLAIRETTRESRLSTEYQVGELVSGYISGFKHYGVFVRLPNGESGLVFSPEISWRGDDVSYRVGQDVMVEVTGFKPGRGLALSLKKVRAKEFLRTFLESHRAGDVVDGSIASVKDYGMFIQVKPGVFGLLHVNNIKDRSLFSRDAIGTKVRVRILSLDQSSGRMNLEFA